MTRSRRWLAFVLLGMTSCYRFTPDQILEEWPEGVLPQHQELRQEWWDYDSGAISFSYKLPSSSRDTAIEQLRRQIQRSAGRSSAPTESCFEVIAQTVDYLLTSCQDGAAYQAQLAWEVRLTEDVVTVIAGPRDIVLSYLVAGPKNRPVR